jgi:hypothetical protein
MSNFFHFQQGDPNRGTVSIPELDLYNMSKGVNGKWSALAGWNNYLQTGNFIGCRPIIKPGAKFNVSAFETINFEMI